MAKLYGCWQTELFENKLNPDGTLPENEYGNIEINRPQDIPKGWEYVNWYYAANICRKNDIGNYPFLAF